MNDKSFMKIILINSFYIFIKLDVTLRLLNYLMLNIY